MPWRNQPGMTTDGELASWAEIATRHEWRALLLGNGLSMSVWPGFGYASLFQRASLAPEDRALFRSLQTENFEAVLAGLETSIRVRRALGEDVAPLIDRYRSVQRALGEAVRAVHIPWRTVPASTLRTIQRELQRYDVVFTTNYDLLLYWAMGHEDDYGRLVDCFWGADGHFDRGDARVRARSTPVLFLHGALHLLADAAGRTRKLRRRATRALLDQLGLRTPDDRGSRPLLVTEGSADEKLRAIESNEYLRFAHAMLRGRPASEPLVVFGSSLSEHDGHLTDALVACPTRPVAVSMLPAPARELRVRQAAIRARLPLDQVLFFDATTHPLGAISPTTARSAATSRLCGGRQAA